MGKSDEEKLKNVELYMLKVSSISDLCRGACMFSEKYPDALFSFDFGGKNVLARLSHHIDKVLLVNYVETPHKSRMIKYTVLPDEEEKVEFVEKAGLPQQGVCYIDIIRADLAQMIMAKNVDKANVLNIPVGSDAELVKSIIIKHMHSAGMPAVFSFVLKGRNYLTAFDVFPELVYEKCLLCHAKTEEKREFNFIKYNFETDSLSYSAHFGSHESNTAYVKVIHLIEPFPFFKA